MNHIDFFTCDHCHEERPISEQLPFGGETLCERCFEDLTAVCSRCGERIWADDNEGDSGTVLCQDCDA